MKERWRFLVNYYYKRQRYSNNLTMSILNNLNGEWKNGEQGT